MKSACSLGRGVKGGLVAGDNITQLVICERMRWRLGTDMVTVVVMLRDGACGSGKASNNSLDRHARRQEPCGS